MISYRPNKQKFPPQPQVGRKTKEPMKVKALVLSQYCNEVEAC